MCLTVRAYPVLTMDIGTVEGNRPIFLNTIYVPKLPIRNSTEMETRKVGLNAKSSDLYSRGAQFKSRYRHQLLRLRILMVLVSPSN